MGMTGFKVLDSDASVEFLGIIEKWAVDFYKGNKPAQKIIKSFFDNYSANAHDTTTHLMTTILALKGKELIYKSLLHDPENNKFNFSVPINVLGWVFMNAQVPAEYLTDLFLAMTIATELEIKELDTKEYTKCITELYNVLNVTRQYKDDIHCVSNGALS